MYIATFKNYDNIEWYGDVPEISDEPSESILVEDYTAETQEAFIEDFIDPINELCDTGLCIYDFEFFDIQKCKLMKEWIETRLSEPCDTSLVPIYKKLFEFCNIAIASNTGISISL